MISVPGSRTTPGAQRQFRHARLAYSGNKDGDGVGLVMKRFSRGFPRRPAPGFTVLFIPLTSTRLFSMSAFVESRQRSRYLSLLQIVGALGVVTVHVGVPYCRPFWFFLEVFFVMAGLNMAKALDGDQPLYAYAVSRVRRLGPRSEERRVGKEC